MNENVPQYDYEELYRTQLRPENPILEPEPILNQAYQEPQAEAPEGEEAPNEENEEGENEDESLNAFANVGQGLTGQYKQMMMQYWQEVINLIERQDHDFKTHQLPLARIKKVMKTDEAVRMISAEAPILFAKGCDIFITELTMRAWIHAEENKRRTLQKLDISAALQKLDMFDFLIDIVPRDDDKPKRRSMPLLADPEYQYGEYEEGKELNPTQLKYNSLVQQGGAISLANTLNSLTTQALGRERREGEFMEGQYYPYME